MIKLTMIHGALVSPVQHGRCETGELRLIALVPVEVRFALMEGDCGLQRD